MPILTWLLIFTFFRDIVGPPIRYNQHEIKKYNRTLKKHRTQILIERFCFELHSQIVLSSSYKNSGTDNHGSARDAGSCSVKT